MNNKRYYVFSDGITFENGKPLPKVGQWVAQNRNASLRTGGFCVYPHPFSALESARGVWLHQVELGGTVIHDTVNDSVYASNLRLLSSLNTRDLCLRFARKCAGDALGKWPASDVVRKYIKTGDPSLQRNANEAAYEFGRKLSSKGEWCKVEAAFSTMAAAQYVAFSLIAIYSARASAWAACRACQAKEAKSKLVKYRAWFKRMVDEEFSRAGLTDAIPGLLSGESNGAGNLKES